MERVPTWLGRETLFQWGRPWGGWWAQVRWMPRRWNLGAGVVVGMATRTPRARNPVGDSGFYVRLGPVWIDVGHGAQRPR